MIILNTDSVCLNAIIVSPIGDRKFITTLPQNSFIILAVELRDELDMFLNYANCLPPEVLTPIYQTCVFIYISLCQQ